MKKSNVPAPLPLTGGNATVKTTNYVESKKTGDFVPLSIDFAESYGLDKKVAHEFCIKADAVITGHRVLSGAYADLCLYIKTNGIAPKAVSEMLGSVGFKKSRISEINSVANADSKVFDKLTAKEIGFREALQLSRGNGVAESMDLDQAEVDKKLIEAEESASNQHGVKKKAVKPKVKFAALAKSILALADKHSLQPLKKLDDHYTAAVTHAQPVLYSAPNGGDYIVVVFRLPSKAKPVQEAAGETGAE